MKGFISVSVLWASDGQQTERVRMTERLNFFRVLIWCVFFGCLAARLPLTLYLLLFRFAAGKLVFVVFFFPLHAPVLKPDLHLSLGEGESVRHFDAPLAGQVGIKQELLLQLERLIAAVGLPAPSPTGSCWGKRCVSKQADFS